MSRTISFLFGLAVGALALAPTAQARPLALEDVLTARETLSYRGLLRVTRTGPAGTRQQRLRVTRAGHQRVRQELLDASGAVRDVLVSDGAVRWHHTPRLRAVTVSPLEAEGSLPRRLALARRNYGFRVLGQLRHLNRLVLLVQLTPRAAGNLTHRLWVDQATRLPLVVERRDEAGQLVDRSEFLSITFSPRLSPEDTRFRLPPGVRVSNATTVLAQGSSGSLPPAGQRWRPEPPRWLPKGYELLHWQHFLDHRRVPTFVWRYHDGLSLLSCFATDARSQASPPADSRAVRVGAGEGFALAQGPKHLLSWRVGQTAYTLVGHLPEAILDTVAGSVP
ncbi:MAG: sigma-E factor regulatory protein RseB domain-containing protein [Candidatus Sericytochromatia bacterium]|nr:sigma-E factor regulatory protein RseB domain-containing protein [Candidatus Sericytochromatia bacterium]